MTSTRSIVFPDAKCDLLRQSELAWADVLVLEQHAVLDSAAQNMLHMAQQRLNLSARAYHRVLRVARTIADLAQAENIQNQHLSEALSYRGQMP